MGSVRIMAMIMAKRSVASARGRSFMEAQVGNECICRKLALLGARGDPLEKRILIHGRTPSPYFFLLPAANERSHPAKSPATE